MAKNLPQKMPASATFIFDNGTGKKQADVTKVIKGGDLRSRKGNNNGR